MNRPSMLTFLLLGVVTLLPGCSRTVTGGFEDSPDKKYRMYGRAPDGMKNSSASRNLNDRDEPDSPPLATFAYGNG